MSGNSGPSGGSVANRSLPAGASPAPPAPLIAPTGSAGIDAVLDVVNSTVAPFTSLPPPEQGVAGVVSQELGGVLGVIGAPEMIIDTAFAALTAPLAALFPALPAITLLGLHVGVPHAHLHPPSLIPPAPPVPLPSIGMLVGAGAITVLIGGVPAARAGDIGISVTCGSLAPPFEVFTGSSNVFIGGARAARILDITKHCNPTSMGPFAIAMGAAGAVAGAAGAIATGSVAAAAQTAANAAVLAIQMLCGKDPGIPPGIGALLGPPVTNVLIGGFPCPPIGQMAMGALMRALKQAIKNWKKGSSRASNGHCGEAGEPISLVTGENFSSFVDFVSGGLFEWRRHYTTARCRDDSPLGHGWRHFYQRALRVRLHRAIFTDWDGETIEFPRFERGAAVTRAAGRVLRRLARGHYRLSHRSDPVLEFIGDEFAGELPLTRVLREDRELALSYDRLGRLSAVRETSPRSGACRRYAFHYAQDDGHIRAVVEAAAEHEPGQPSAQRATYAYTPRNELAEAQDALRGRWRYEYNGFHCLTRQTDPRNYSYWYKYDGWQRCIETSGQDGLWWAKAEYFPDKGFTRLTEGEGAVWEYHYERDGFISKVVDPYGGVRVRERDASGQVTRDVDSGGRELRWLYDGDGANCGRVDRFGNFFPPALELPHLPDPFARKLPSTSLEWQLGGRSEQQHWPPARSANGPTNRLLDELPPELTTLAKACFRQAQPPSKELPHYVEFDLMGRKVREADGLGRERRWEYDASGNLIAERDPDGRVSTQQVISWNLIGEKRDALGYAMRYEYSRLERLTGLTDPLGNATRYDYDLKNRLTRIHRHGKLREEYVYDGGDHFIEKRDGSGNLLFRNDIHKNHFVAVRHLASGGFHRFDYDARGRIVEASTQDHEVRLHYDALGLPLQDVRDGTGVVHHRLGSRLVTQLLERFTQSREEQPLGVEISDPAGQRTLLEHTEDGFVRRTCSNNTVELLRYDATGRLDSRFIYRRDWRGCHVRFSTRYVYSAAGDLLQVEDNERGTVYYETDAAHRLVAEWTSGGKRREFRQDAAGNVLAKPGWFGAGLGRGNQLSSSADESFLYDSRDHLAERRHIDGSIVRYIYDSFDMLVRIERVAADGTPAEPWEAAYDAIGRRIWSRQGEQLRRFFWDGDRLAAEILPSGRVRIYQYASRSALTPLSFTEYASSAAEASSGCSYQVFSDPVGMPLCIEDERGEVVWWANRIDPYGQIDIRDDVAIEYNLRWPGHYFDRETGLHYNRYRYYDPQLGRYLQSDPLGYKGSPINLYAYCSNPLVQVDILGLHRSEKEDSDEGKSKNQGKEEVADSKKTSDAEITAAEERGKLRAETYEDQWPPASLKDTVNKICGNNPEITQEGGKTIYKNSETGQQVVYDRGGDYFRIQDTNVSSKRNHLDTDGNRIPSNKTVTRGDGSIKETGMSKEEYNQISHYKNTDNNPD